MRKRLILIALLAAALMVLAACGGKKPESATVEPTASEAAATERQASVTAKPEATEEPTAIPEEDTLSLDSRATGLDQLKSYRLRWQSEWTATDSGETSTGKWDWSEE